VKRLRFSLRSLLILQVLAILACATVEGTENIGNVGCVYFRWIPVDQIIVFPKAVIVSFHPLNAAADRKAGKYPASWSLSANTRDGVSLNYWWCGDDHRGHMWSIP
jgi:hypothetical protein